MQRLLQLLESPLSQGHFFSCPGVSKGKAEMGNLKWVPFSEDVQTLNRLPKYPLGNTAGHCQTDSFPCTFSSSASASAIDMRGDNQDSSSTTAQIPYGRRSQQGAAAELGKTPTMTLVRSQHGKSCLTP